MLISKTDWFQGILVVFSAVSSYLIGNKGRGRKWGFALGTIQQPLWVFTAYEAGLWGMFLLTCFYCYTWARGLWNNWFPENPNKSYDLTLDQKEQILLANKYIEASAPKAAAIRFRRAFPNLFHQE